jgi:hypothetical protein
MSDKQPVSLSELLKASDERDELRAEVERLRAESQAQYERGWDMAWEAGQKELERLRADNTRAANELVEYGKLIAKGGAEEQRLRAAMSAVLKAHAEWNRACELDSDHADDAWYGLHDAIEHDLAPLVP